MQETLVCLHCEHAEQDEPRGNVPNKDQLQLCTLVQMPIGYVHDLLHNKPHSLIYDFGATRYGIISRALKNQRLVLNIVVPLDEVMAHGYVEDYGPSSQRQYHP